MRAEPPIVALRKRSKERRHAYKANAEPMAVQLESADRKGKMVGFLPVRAFSGVCDGCAALVLQPRWSTND